MKYCEKAREANEVGVERAGNGAAEAVPGLRGVEHVGITVPDMAEAEAFFVDVLGCELLYPNGPGKDPEGDYFAVNLGVHSRAEIRAIRFFRCANGANFEVFEYAAPDKVERPPRPSDTAIQHVAFYTDDIDGAVARLRSRGVRFLGDIKDFPGPERGEGARWVYFYAPWGTVFELVTYPHGMAYEATTAGRRWRPEHRRTKAAGPDLDNVTADEAVLVLVDYTSGLMPLVRTMEGEVLKNNVVALAKIARTFGLPTFVAGDEDEFRGEQMPELAEILPEAERVERHTPSVWRAEGFPAKVAATGRRRLILAGVSTDTCVGLTAIDALRAGYEVYVVLDASGCDSRLAEEAAIGRLTRAGAVMGNWVQLGSELLQDWRTPAGDELGRIYAEHIGGPRAAR